MRSLSQRLTDGLIGEDEKPYLLENHTTDSDGSDVDLSEMYEEVERNELRAEQRQALKPTIATIEADLKGLMPKKIVYPNPPADTSVLTPEVFDYYVAAAQFDYSYAAAYNQALADIDAAIEHYTRDK